MYSTEFTNYKEKVRDLHILVLVFVLVFVVGYKVAWNYKYLILELRLDFIHDFGLSVFRL